MTYAELLQLVQDELENEETSFVTNIPNFVKAAEDDIYKNAQIHALRKEATGSLVASTSTLAIPSDFIAPYSLSVTSGTTVYYLLNREPDFIQEAYPGTTTTGRPKYYGILNEDNFTLGPTPDDTYTYSLHYFYKPASVVDDSETWVSINAPNALMYGTFIHAYAYLKGDADIMMYYRDEYLRALANLQVISEGRMRKDTYRRPNIRQDT
jgi:hypothetical protein